MFPFSYKGKLIFHDETISDTGIKAILQYLKSQFDDCQLQSNSLSFSGFNALVKRQRWLSNGKIGIIKQTDNLIKVELELDFSTMGILLLFLTVFVVFMEYKTIYLAIFSTTVFWLFFFILQTWTVLLYKSMIRIAIGGIYKTGNNKLNGVIKNYYSNGKLMSKIPYINSKKFGVAEEYYENGILKSETTYVNDIIESVSTYDENGNEIKK